MRTYFSILFCIVLGICIASCNSDYIPKPTGYYHIDFPKKSYQTFQLPNYPYAFEYPTYAKIVRDSTFFSDKPENPYWLNVYFPAFNATIYLSYKSVGAYKLNRLVDDAYNLTNKHTVKATAIDDSLMTTPLGIHGVYFKVAGDVATARQFLLTDSTKNFLRGAIYFYATPNQDSLQPVLHFIEKDMKHLINTLHWTK